MARVVRSTAFQSNETYFIYLFFCVQSALRKTYYSYVLVDFNHQLMLNNTTKILILQCIYSTFRHLDTGCLFTELLLSTSPQFVRAVSSETEIFSYLGFNAPPRLREGSVYHVRLLFVKGHITVSVFARAVRNYGALLIFTA